MLLRTALKEWSVAVDALAAGDMMVLVRKGGIKEEKGRFVADAENAILFPTFEHQKPELLKPPYRDALTPVEPGWHPKTITLKAWAQITDIFLTRDADKVAALADFHIWQPQLAQKRLRWKAKQPLYVLALRTYRLKQPVEIEWQEAYGGCRSWIELAGGIDVTDSGAAISDDAYAQKIGDIKTCLEH